MASKFLPGMKNVLEVLNQMWDAFAAGPYNALPLTGGVLTGPVMSTSDLTTNTLKAIDVAATRYLTAGPGTPMPHHALYRDTNEGGAFLFASRVGQNGLCFGVRASSGTGGYSGALTVMYVGKSSTTNRSLNAAGTINGGGADYAEYLIKALLCGTIAPGQIVGIDVDGKLTDKWDRAIAFMTKSTNPCMVGGDSWSQELGARPVAPVRIAPIMVQELVSPADDEAGAPVVYRNVMIAPGDTDEEWADKMATYSAAAVEFDEALEVLRRSVDRIAFAGQVPVNVWGAAPGQYIVPVQDGEGIAGIAMDKGDMTLDQYVDVIGRVIAIEDDGRARIIVKVA